MKKIYVSPESLTVQIRPMSILMGSDPSANIDTEDAGIAPGSFGTKVISDKNIWDDEW